MTATGPLLPDTAHTPSLAYVPYLVTGDRYYADEMSFWTDYGLTKAVPAARNYTQGLVYPGKEERTLAWQMRNMADPAAYLPGNDPMRSYFADKLENNLSWADAYTAGHQTPLHSSFELTLTPNPQEQLFEDSYLVWSIEHANQLGFTGGDVAKNQIEQFVLQLFTSSDFNPYGALAENLTVGTKNADGTVTYYSTLQQLFNANYPNGVTSYSAYYAPEDRIVLAYALQDGLSGAQGAYNWIYPISVSWMSGLGAGFAIQIV
jgi:hypothetical protein